MKPIKFRQQNVIYVAEDCGNLPAYKGYGQIISCWKMTLVERIKALITGKVWLSVLGINQPPVYLCVNNPFKEGGNDD